MKPIFLLLMFSMLALGQENKIVTGFDPSKDVLADDYEAGEFLIYDCEEKHWTCVLESYYQDCQAKRAKDLENPNSYDHTCVPVETFPNKRACFQRQLFLVTNNYSQRFCQKEEWKEKTNK